MFSTTFLICLPGLLALYHLQRKIYALRNYVATAPCLDDIWRLSVLAAATAALAQWLPVMLPLALALLLLCALLLWADALLIHLYGFEVSLGNLRIFLQGAESFGGEFAVLPRTFAKRPWFLAMPVAALALLAVLALPAEHRAFAPAAGLLVAAWLFGVSKSKLRWKSAPLWLLVWAGAGWLVAALAPHWPPALSPIWGAATFGLIALAKLLSRLPVLRGRFWSARSDLAHFLVGERLQPAPGLALREQHRALVAPAAQPLTASTEHGRCRGANVILITLESLSREHVDSYVPGGAHMATFERLCASGLRSDAHYACSPNTNRAIEHLYRADYPHQSAFPFLPALREAGYRSAYMMISRTRYFNLRDILAGIGFDHVWDQDSEGFDPARGDYSFVDSVDKIADTLRGAPFFLHLKSEQTHSPYQVVQSERFNRFDTAEREQHYLNAIEESDHVIGEFLAALGERLDLSNTIVVYTGDHGQSFGEFGYVSHSSATVKQQVRVPFVLSHPALAARGVEQSTHFDVMPTVFDLLGLTPDYRCFGRSLLLPAEPRALLLYSQTRRGNAPSNMSLLSADEKIMLDLIYGYRYRLNHEDEILATLDDDEAGYYRALFYELLAARGLISQSAFSPRPTTRPD